jgi:hypothetical protein
MLMLVARIENHGCHLVKMIDLVQNVIVNPA